MLTLADIFEALTGTRPTQATASIPHAAIDSRQVQAGSLFIAGLVGMFTGMAFTVSVIVGFRQFSAEGMVGGVVALALARELAPVLAAVVEAKSRARDEVLHGAGDDDLAGRRGARHLLHRTGPARRKAAS